MFKHVSVRKQSLLEQCEPAKTRFEKKKKKRQTRAEKRAKALRSHGAQGERKLIGLSRKDIKYNCCGAGRDCGCKSKVNHWRYVSEETTAHYRRELYDPDPKVDRYQTRIRLHEILTECFLVSRAEQIRTHKYHSLGGKDSKVKTEFFLRDAVTGNKIPLCKKVFCAVLGISSALLHRVSKLVKAGKKAVPDKRFAEWSAGREPSAEYLAICTFLEALAEDLANESPDTRLMELPSGHKIVYYQLFCEDWKRGFLTGEYYRSARPRSEEPPSRALFYKVWAREFPSLMVPKRQNRFSKCDTCCALRANLDAARKSGDQDAVDEWKEKLYGHYKWVMMHRRKYRHHRKKACDNPEK